MHVIITGGLGFIGSSVAKKLVAEGNDVSIIDNASTSITATIPGTKSYQLNLLDPDALQNACLPDVDCVMHLGGASSGPASAANPVGTVSDGYAITFNVLEMAHRVNARKFLFASSMTVYGNISDHTIPVREDAACNPISHYGIGKFANERLVEVYCCDKNIGFNNLRLFNVYGPGQDLARADQGLVSIFLALLMKNPKVVSRGSLKRFRDIVHIDDVVSALCLCADESVISGPFNVGCGEAITIGDLIEEIADALGIGDQLQLEADDGSPGDMFGIYADMTALRSSTGFSPRYRPHDGIQQFTKWALSSESTNQPDKEL